MEETSESTQGDDWLAGAMIEFGGEVDEQTEVALDGIEFGDDEEINVA